MSAPVTELTFDVPIEIAALYSDADVTALTVDASGGVAVVELADVTLLSPALQPLTVLAEGAFVGARGSINYTDGVNVPTDNPAENRIDMPLSAAGGLNAYVHTQGSASDTWTVNHNLGRLPAVEVFSPGGVVVDAEIVHATANQTLIYFAQPYSGSARFV